MRRGTDDGAAGIGVTMIAWWGWVVIWVLLVVILLAVFGLLVWRLFRKFMALLDDLTDLGDRASELRGEEEPIGVPLLAVLADTRDVRAREDERVERRRLRAADRRERRVARAEKLARVDITTAEWPEAFSQGYRRRRAYTRHK